MRVLHLINALQPGGIEMWLLNMLSEIPRDEVAMDFFCKGTTTGMRADDAKDMGAAVIHCPLTISHSTFIGGLSRLLQCGYYDVVHNHLDVTGGVAIWAAKKANVPIVSSFHNTHFAPQTWTRMPGVRQLRALYGKMSIDYSLRHSQVITGCSQAVLDSVLPENRKDPRCRLLYYGVETAARADEQERSAFRQSLGIPDSAPIVLHVGRFFRQKNHGGLLRIFARIREQRRDAVLVLVGDGVLRNEISSRIARLDLKSSVRMLGFRNDVPYIMNCSDVLLLPSFHEGLPVVSLEACANQLPLVGSNIPGTNEAIVNGQTGLLHDLKDEQAMAESALRLLQQPGFADQIRDAASVRIEKFFSRRASAEALVRLYRETSGQIEVREARAA